MLTVPQIRLNNGVEIPQIGLGVYLSRPGEETRRAVAAALEAGYRMVDTASAYHNEADVGWALRESGLPRGEVFLTSKLANADHGYEKTLRACHESLRRMDAEYLDLYLIHWPGSGLRKETWQAMERLLADGLCRAIGVSNYTVRHLEELLGYAQVLPAVDQVEFHPFLYQRVLLDWVRHRGIVLVAYSPLVRARRLKDPLLLGIAQTHAKSPAQVLIRWSIQHGLVVIPKSVHAERIRENLAVLAFELTHEEMKRLDALDEGFRIAWDPTDVP